MLLWCTMHVIVHSPSLALIPSALVPTGIGMHMYLIMVNIAGTTINDAILRDGLWLGSRGLH